MQPKRQFQTSAHKRTFFDRKVLHYGYTRSLSMGKIIPKTWQYVRMSVVEKTDSIIVVKLEKMWSDTDNALGAKDDKAHRHDT